MAQISTYGTLKTEIANKLERSNLTADIPLFIQLAQLRMYRDLHIRPFEASLSTAIASGTIAVPTGYLGFKYIYIDGSPMQKLERKDAEWIYHNYPTRSASGKPCYIAREAETFIFGPYPDSTYTVKGVYYKKLAAFSADGDTNWFVTDGADATFYASLFEAYSFIHDEPNAQKYDAMYQRLAKRILADDEQEDFSGSPLQVSVR